MNKKEFLVVLILFLLGICTRIPFFEKMQSHWDGPQYSIGVLRYSLEQQTPAPPGYPLYIAIGRLLYGLTKDSHLSLLFVSALFSGLAASLFYVVGRAFYNSMVGIIASILYLSGPSFYYFGLSAYPYGLLPSVVVLLAFCVYLIVEKRFIKGIFLGAIFSLSIGIRPQETPMLTPLFFLGLYYLPKKERVTAILSFLLIFFAWFLPFMSIVGGVNSYIFTLSAFINKGAIETLSFIHVKESLLRMFKGVFLSFTLGSFFLLFYVHQISLRIKGIKKIKNVLNDKKFQILSAWIVPSALSNLLIRTDHAGYQMTYLSGILLLIAYVIWRLFNKKERILFLVVMVITIFNTWWFFRDRDPEYLLPYTQTSFHHSEIQKNDIQLGSKVEYIKKNYDPKKTVLITEAVQWRQIMYHLPEYLTYDLDGLFTLDPRYKFIVRRSQYWSYTEENVSRLLFTVPKNATQIIFMNENTYPTIQAERKRLIKLEGNAELTYVPVVPGEIYTYGQRSFKKN